MIMEIVNLNKQVKIEWINGMAYTTDPNLWYLLNILAVEIRYQSTVDQLTIFPSSSAKQHNNSSRKEWRAKRKCKGTEWIGGGGEFTTMIIKLSMANVWTFTVDRGLASQTNKTNETRG